MRQKIDPTKMFVRLSFHHTDKIHGFRANVYQGTKIIKSKQKSINKSVSQEMSYLTADDYAQELAKEYNCEYVERSMEEVLETHREYGTRGLGNRGVAKPADEIPETVNFEDVEEKSEIMEAFGHGMKFKAMLKKAMHNYGWKRVETMLKDGLELVEELSEEIRKKELIAYQANHSIAKAILEAERQGVKMDIPNADVKHILVELRKNSSKGKNKKETQYTFYELDGIRWNGTGAMPANFIQFKREGGNVESLRCA